MGGAKVVVYGLSTEGYAIASQMAIKGADVYIIDESTPSAISLKAEIAKTYPNVSSLKEDEPLLAMEPIDVAISKAQYLFFTPRIRKTGQDIKTEIHSKFKDAVASMKKNSSVIFTLPTGFGGNNENISLLEHVTGFETGKHISYFYYPLEDLKEQPKIIGSFNGKEDPTLAELLTLGKKEKKFVAISSSEHFHAIAVLSRFSSLCSVLEVCKYAQDDITKNDLSSDDFQETGDIIFRREKQIHAIHEVEFHELSIITVSDANRPENALWSEKHITYGDMDSHDSIFIHLNYGAKWDRQFFFLQPRENHQIIKVSQRHENVMMFPGDGTHCELQNWKRYRSSWKDLHSEAHFFMTQAYDAEERQRFPDYLPEELLAAFRLTCGSEEIAEEYRNIISLPHPDHGRVAPTRIIIRVEFSGPLGTGMKYLIFNLANSC